MDNLRFQNGSFRVMLVGDPHCEATDDTPRAAAVIKDYLALQYAALEQAKPDLVVLMGDNASGDTPEEIKKTLLRITRPYVDLGVPFTFILGNHDLQYANSSLEALYVIYRELPGILMPDDVNEFGDFDLHVRGSESDDTKLELAFLYSGSSPEAGEYSYYDAVHPEQTRQLKNRLEAYGAANGRIPAVVFQHIPVPEEFALLNERSVLCMFGGGVKGQNEQAGKFYTIKKGVEGYLGEAPCTPARSSGEFNAWKETGSVFAAFFGHDHLNDFVGMHDGIILGQCKTASFNVYGDGLRQGVRIVDFCENAPFTLNTHMLTYRELLGKSCNSLHGSIAVLHDKTSMKLHQLAKCGAVCAVLTLPVMGIRHAVKKRRSRR